jgi:hypothetical protein
MPRDFYYRPRLPYAETPPDPRERPVLPRGVSTPMPKTMVAEIGPDGIPYLREEWKPTSLEQYQNALTGNDFAPMPQNFTLVQQDLRRLAQLAPEHDPEKTGSYGREDFWRDNASWGAMPKGADKEAYMRQLMIDRDVDGARLARERARRAVYGNALSRGQK